MRFWSNFLYDLIKNVNYLKKSSSGQTKTITRMASPFFKKGRKCIYLFVRIFRWRKAVRNHLLNRQSKERRGCRLLRCVNSLLCIWDVLFGWNENILRRARLYGLLLSGCSLCEMQVRAHIQTQRGSCFKASAGGELQPADSTTDTPKAKQSTGTACPCCHVLDGSTD